jgi:hypothetical protein
MTTEAADPIVAVEALIVERRKALDQLESACSVYRTAFGLSPAGAAAAIVAADTPASTRRKPLAAGALPDRIVSTLKEAGEPLSFIALVGKVKASEPSVRKALNQLVAEDRAKRIGQSRGTRYSA